MRLRSTSVQFRVRKEKKSRKKKGILFHTVGHDFAPTNPYTKDIQPE